MNSVGLSDYSRRRQGTTSVVPEPVVNIEEAPGPPSDFR